MFGILGFNLFKVMIDVKLGETRFMVGQFTDRSYIIVVNNVILHKNTDLEFIKYQFEKLITELLDRQLSCL